MKAIHNSRISELVFKAVRKQEVGPKPKGLWYGLDDSWIDWCRSEMPNWVHLYNFEIKIDYKKMLVIDSEYDLRQFSKNYSTSSRWDFPSTIGSYNLNWLAVARLYDGIEIAPYRYDCRFDLNWYNTWDVASGCIWRKNAIRSITKMEVYK